MLSDDEFQELIEHLHSKDLSLRVAALKDIWQYPSGDVRILQYLEAALDDTTPCVVMLPYHFGEVRWLAAYALAAERAAMGIDKSVVVCGVAKPLDTEELSALAKKASADCRGGVEGMLEIFKILREKGQLPLYDVLIQDGANLSQSLQILSAG